MEIDSPLDTLKINLPQPLHNIITLNQDEEKTYNMETAFIFKDKQSHLDAPYPEIIPFIDDETSKIENMPRSSNLDNPEKISGNLSTIKEGKNDDIDMQALESIYIDKLPNKAKITPLSYEDNEENIISLYREKNPNDPFHFFRFRMTKNMIDFIIQFGPLQPSSNEFIYPKTHNRHYIFH
ncbi:unnamed protein product [Gordionus sp. m RMFG-2023]